MCHLSKIFACLVVSAPILYFSVFSDAHAQQTRTLAGEVNLDIGGAETDLVMDITVNNHSFVVVPPSFTIIRPITSKQTRRIAIK